MCSKPPVKGQKGLIQSTERPLCYIILGPLGSPHRWRLRPTREKNKLGVLIVLFGLGDSFPFDTSRWHSFSNVLLIYLRQIFILGTLVHRATGCPAWCTLGPQPAFRLSWTKSYHTDQAGSFYVGAPAPLYNFHPETFFKKRSISLGSHLK